MLKKKEDDEPSAFLQLSEITVAVYFTEFESIIVYRSTRRACCLSEKAYNIRVREFSPVTFVKANGRVCVIPTYRVYRLYDDFWYYHFYIVVISLFHCLEYYFHACLSQSQFSVTSVSIHT